MLTKFEGFFYALTSHFPNIEEYETYEIGGCLSHYNFAFGRKSVDVFSETGIGSRFSALTLKTSTVMKKKNQSALVPVSKLQNYFSGLANLLAKNSDSYVVSHSGNTTSIELSPGQYITISTQKGGQS